MHQAERMKDLNVSVIVCPSAAISMKQNHFTYSPIHNSIAPVNMLLETGVDVKLGIDMVLTFDIYSILDCFKCLVQIFF